MYKGVNGGRWSVVTGLAVATALYITVASLVKSKSNALLYCSPFYTVRFCISTVRVEVIVWLIVVLTFLFFWNSSIDEALVEGPVSSSIDANFVEDRMELSSLLLSCCAVD